MLGFVFEWNENCNRRDPLCPRNRLHINQRSIEGIVFHYFKITPQGCPLWRRNRTSRSMDDRVRKRGCISQTCVLFTAFISLIHHKSDFTTTCALRDFPHQMARVQVALLPHDSHHLSFVSCQPLPKLVQPPTKRRQARLVHQRHRTIGQTALSGGVRFEQDRAHEGSAGASGGARN